MIQSVYYPKGTIAIGSKVQIYADLLRHKLLELNAFQMVTIIPENAILHDFWRSINIDLAVLDETLFEQYLQERGELNGGCDVGTKVLFLTDDSKPLCQEGVMKLGCRCIHRNTNWEGFVEILQEISPETLGNTSLGEGKTKSPAVLRIDSILTRRQMEVFVLLAKGNTVQECADVLGVSRSTVDNHKTGLMSRLGVHRSSQLVRLAVRYGVISP